MEELGCAMNDHVPNIAPLFKKRLRMKPQQADFEARVANNCMDFDALVEECGLTPARKRDDSA